MKKAELNATYTEKSFECSYCVFKYRDYSLRHRSLEKLDTCGLVPAASGASDGCGAATNAGTATPGPRPSGQRDGREGGLGPPSLGSWGYGPALPSSLITIRSMMQSRTKSFNISPVVLWSCFALHHPAAQSPVYWIPAAPGLRGLQTLQKEGQGSHLQQGC